MASTKVPRDGTTGSARDPSEEAANDGAGKPPETAGRTDAERALSERVRRKILSIRRRTKHYVS